MPRQPRLDAPGTLHHVMGRGIEGVKLFRDDTDRKDFVDRLSSLCRNRSLNLYAWAFLPNHFHLFVRTGNQPLAKSMKRLLTGYVVNFNLRHRRRGHLFQNRYKSIVCEEDPYLLELTRYIHLNPLRAGIVKDLKGLGKYPWTGHSAIVGEVKRDWQDTDTILGYFGKGKRRAVLGYEKFVAEGTGWGRRLELVGGGLVRSMGGWSEVRSLRKRGIKAASDDRILGSREFVMGLFSEAEAAARETLRLFAKVPDLESLAGRIGKGEGTEEADLRSGIRSKKVSKARRLFCQLAVRKMGHSGADVARFLGVTTSAVSRLANSADLPELRRYL